MFRDIEMRNNLSGMVVWVTENKVYANPKVEFHWGPVEKMAIKPCDDGHHVADVEWLESPVECWRLKIVAEWFNHFFNSFHCFDVEDEDYEFATKESLLAEVMEVADEGARGYTLLPEVAEELNARIRAGEFDHLDGKRRIDAIVAESLREVRKAVKPKQCAKHGAILGFPFFPHASLPE